jgi:predicted dehydrogenase
VAIEIVIAGMGSRGRDWVREVRNSPAFKLAAAVEVDQNVLEDVSGKLSIPRQQCFTSLETALTEIPCQAVIVATPADSHVAPVDTALHHGRAVMVEKPFTICLSDAIRLVQRAEQNKLPLLVAQNYRYLRSFRTARRLIADGTLGKVNLVTCQYYRPAHEMPAWLARLHHSVLWGMGVHHLDALRHVLGKEVVGVSAESFARPNGELPPGASMQAMLSFEGDIRALYSASYESSGHEFFEKGQEFYARFVGDRGTLHVFQRWLIWCETGKLPKLVRRGPRKVSEEQILLQQLERAVLHGEPAEINGRDNLKTMALLEACVRSAANHNWINPQDLLNEPN